MRGGVPPYRKLTLAEAFDKGTVSNAYGSSMQAGAARRIPVRLRESRRAAFVEVDGAWGTRRVCVWEWMRSWYLMDTQFEVGVVFWKLRGIPSRGQLDDT